jgi:hypothetical protein
VHAPQFINDPFNHQYNSKNGNNENPCSNNESSQECTYLVENKIAKTWISGQKSCTLIIERKLAEEYGLSEPSHVVLEKRADGILIRKLEV